MPKNVKLDKRMKRLQTALMVDRRIKGKTLDEIGEEFNICRQAVAKRLASQEAEAIVKNAEDDVTRLCVDSIRRMQKVINDDDDNTNALKAAMSVLKSRGVLRDTVDVNHAFPEPTVIRLDGQDRIVLGAKKESDDDQA